MVVADRQIGRSGALEDLSDVNAGLAPYNDEARPIADEAAGHGELTQRIDRRNGMAGCQRRELVAPAGEERIDGEDERASVELDEGGKGGVDLAFAAGLQDLELDPLRARYLKKS